MTVNQLESHELIKPYKNRLQMVVEKILMAHPEGLTVWEIAQIAKRNNPPQRQDIAPRVSELVKKDLVIETGRKRMTPTGRNGEVYMLRRHWETSQKRGNEPDVILPERICK